MKKITQKRTDIQYLRALAVCTIIIFHARQSFLPNGYLGVDIFFFISGYVLTPQLLGIYWAKRENTSQAMTEFFAKRFQRLLPAFSACIMFSILIILLFASLNQVGLSVKQAIYSLVFLGNIGADSLAGNYFNPTPNPFLHFWSLSAEWQIYFFIPLIFLATAIITGRRSKRHLIGILFSIAIASITLLVLFGESNSVFGYYSPIVRIWQFALGSLAFIYLNEGFLSNRLKIGARIIFFICLTFLLSPIQLNQLNANLVSALIFICLILADFKEVRIFGNVLKWIGDRSYSLYLYHLPLIYLAIYSPTSGANSTYRLGGVLSAIIGTFLLASLSFKFTESFEKNSVSKRINNPKCMYLIALIMSAAVFATVLSKPSVFDFTRASVAWQTTSVCTNGVQSECKVVENMNPRSEVLVIGDSHSQHYFREFQSLGKRENIEFSFSTEYNYLEIRKARPSLIILSRFHNSFTNIELEDFQSELVKISSLNIPILYISDNPVFLDYMKYTHYIKPSLFSIALEKLGLSTPPKKQVNIYDLDQNARYSGEKFRLIAQKFGTVIDPFTILCSQSSCRRYESGDWLYWDDHHLSETGAELVFRSLRFKITRSLTSKKLAQLDSAN